MQPFLTAFYKLFVPTAMLLPNFNMFCDIRCPSMRCTVSAYNLVDSIIFCIFVTELIKI